MANINKCFSIHLDLSTIIGFDVLIDKIIDVGSITMTDNSIIVWLNDDKTKDDLTKVLKKCKIKEFFCQQIEY